MRLFIDALWSPAGKGLTSWLSFVMSNCEVPIGIMGHVWCLIVSIPDLCPLSYFNRFKFLTFADNYSRKILILNDLNLNIYARLKKKTAFEGSYVTLNTCARKDKTWILKLTIIKLQ